MSDLEKFYKKVQNDICNSDEVFFLKIPTQLMSREADIIRAFLVDFKEKTGKQMFGIPTNVGIEVISQVDFDQLTGTFKDIPRYETDDLINNAGA